MNRDYFWRNEFIGPFTQRSWTRKLKADSQIIHPEIFLHKNGILRYRGYFVLYREDSYFVKEYSDSNGKHTEYDIINNNIYILKFLIDNIFVVFGGKAFQRIFGIPAVTNCAHFLT